MGRRCGARLKDMHWELVTLAKSRHRPYFQQRGQASRNLHFPLICAPSFSIFMLVAQLWLTLCDPMDYSLPVPLPKGFSKKEYWSGLPFASPGESSKWPRAGIYISCVSCISGRFFIHWAIREAPWHLHWRPKVCFCAQRKKDSCHQHALMPEEAWHLP